MIKLTTMKKLEDKVRRCYEQAPFPDSLRYARNFNIELNRITDWIKLNLDFMIDNPTNYNPKNILCAGCGTGEEALALSKIFPKSKITAIDISKKSLQIAKQNIKKAEVKNIVINNGSILEDLPKLKIKYDFIYCAGVIHHLAYPREGFNILADKLNKDGKMVIMLYNSYGLFFYKCQLFLLNLLARNNFKKRLDLVKKLKWALNKDRAYVYDTYINPQVKTFSISQIKKWSEEEKLTVSGIIPPFSLNKLIKFSILGEKYIFRRKSFVSIIIMVLKLFNINTASKEVTEPIKLSLGRIFFSQLILFITGKGECQYLLERIR